MTDVKAPERIWVTSEYSLWPTFRSFTASDLDHSNDDGTCDYPEYVCADLYDALAKERDELQAEIARLTAERDDWAYKFNEGCNTYSEMYVSLEKAEDERDAAIKALCEAAKAKGQAEGKLAASEMAGVVEGWKTRAEKAEAERDQALARAAAAAMEMREQAASATREMQDINPVGKDYGRENAIYQAETMIRALPIDPDAQKALDAMLAQAQEDAIREAADAYKNGIGAILALLNDGGRG